MQSRRQAFRRALRPVATRQPSTTDCSGKKPGEESRQKDRKNQNCTAEEPVADTELSPCLCQGSNPPASTLLECVRDWIC